MITIVERNFDIFQHRPISLRLKGSSRCSKTFHCVPRSILKFLSQSLELKITTKTQFHATLITAGVLVDAKRGGCQNNQGYRWRWLPGWQQEIWSLCHMFGSLCHLPNCHTASCLCHKNVVFVLSSGDRQHHTADTARGWGLGWCDKNRSLQPSLPTGFQNTIFKIRNSVKWALELWTPYFELSLYHQSISPCHDNTSPVWDEVGTHVKHHFG